MALLLMALGVLVVHDRRSEPTPSLPSEATGSNAPPIETHDVTYRVTRDSNGRTVRLGLTVFEASGPVRHHGAIVLLHGDGFRSGSRAEVRRDAQVAASRGWVAVTVDYRLRQFDRGDLEQTIFAARDALADAFAATDWVRDHAKRLDIAPDRVVAFGISAGGFLSFGLAWLDDPRPTRAGRAVAGAVSASGRFDPLFFDEVRAGDAPMLSFSSAEDPADDVDIQRETCQLARSRSVTCQLRVQDGTEHGLSFVDRFDEVEPFFEQVLGDTP